MRIKILEISKEDAHYPDRDLIVGKTGTVERMLDDVDGWSSCSFKLDGILIVHGDIYPFGTLRFFEIKYEVIDAEG